MQRKATDGAKVLESWPRTQVTYNNPRTELLSESQKGGIAEFQWPYSSLKGHSCKRCLSNVLDSDLKMPKHFQASWTIFSRMIEAVAFIATASKGIGCRCCRCFLCRRTQVLQCKSANSTMARFSKYPTQSIASHIHKPLAIIHKLNCQVRVRRVASDQKYTWLNSIARIHVWKDIRVKTACQIVCLIWTWTCKHIFRAL